MAKKGSGKIRQERLRESIGAFMTAHPHASDDEVKSHVFRENIAGKNNDPAIVDLIASHGVESDRGFVLVAAAIMDDELERLLRICFAARSSDSADVIESLFKGNKEQNIPPLQTTALKIKLAFVLGLIDKQTKKACTILQRMRSTVFAHNRKPQFIRFKDAMEIFDCFPGIRAEIDETQPRETFLHAVLLVVAVMKVSIKNVKRKRPRYKTRSTQ